MKIAKILCVVGIIAAMGGYEQGMFGIIGWAIRTAIFFGLLYTSVVADDALTKRKRAKRAAARKAQKKNKYYIVHY